MSASMSLRVCFDSRERESVGILLKLLNLAAIRVSSSHRMGAIILATHLIKDFTLSAIMLRSETRHSADVDIFI